MDSSMVTTELVVRAVLELGFLIVVLAVLLFFSDFRRRLFALGAGALAFFYVFVGGWSVVQMIDRWQYEYPQKVSYVPLARFAMYQVQLPESVEASYAWEVIRADGSRTQVNVAELFETVGLPSLSSRMREHLTSLPAATTPDERAPIERELELFSEGMLAALGTDGKDVVTVEFLRISGTPDSFTSETIFRWVPINAVAQ